MTQGTLFDLATVPEAPARGLRWERNNAPGKIGARYYLMDGAQDTGYSIGHCGHPTANFPYTGTAPDGAMITAGNGRGFMNLALAKAGITAAYLTTQGVL